MEVILDNINIYTKHVNQIYIRPYPNINDGKWQVSSAEGYSPIWDKDKNELYFHTGEKFYKVKYDIIQTPNGEFFNLNQPEYLFDQNIVFNHLTNACDRHAHVHFLLRGAEEHG